jgi:hypothetical protein
MQRIVTSQFCLIFDFLRKHRQRTERSDDRTLARDELYEDVAPYRPATGGAT